MFKMDVLTGKNVRCAGVQGIDAGNRRALARTATARTWQSRVGRCRRINSRQRPGTVPVTLLPTLRALRYPRKRPAVRPTKRHERPRLAPKNVIIVSGSVSHCGGTADEPGSREQATQNEPSSVESRTPHCAFRCHNIRRLYGFYCGTATRRSLGGSKLLLVVVSGLGHLRRRAGRNRSRYPSNAAASLKFASPSRR